MNPAQIDLMIAQTRSKAQRTAEMIRRDAERVATSVIDEAEYRAKRLEEMKALFSGGLPAWPIATPPQP